MGFRWLHVDNAHRKKPLFIAIRACLYLRPIVTYHDGNYTYSTSVCLAIPLAALYVAQGVRTIDARL
jgi:hypothetical protein